MIIISFRNNFTFPIEKLTNFLLNINSYFSLSIIFIDANLVADQLENGASEYVFDNPAFGNDVSKLSDLTMDSKWTSQHNSMDKRKTVDDSSTNVSLAIHSYLDM